MIRIFAQLTSISLTTVLPKTRLTMLPWYKFATQGSSTSTSNNQNSPISSSQAQTQAQMQA